MLIVSKTGPLFYRLLKYRAYRDETGIYIAKGSRLSSKTTIGDGTRINGKIVIKGSGNCEIKKYCAIGEDVKIITSNHDSSEINLQYALQSKIGLQVTPISKNVTIGNNVWISDSVIVLSGVNIGNGAVLAAGAIVTKDVPAYAVVGGSPAKIIKYRFSQEKICEIEDSQWWNWSIAKMKRNHSFFTDTE